MRQVQIRTLIPRLLLLALEPLLVYDINCAVDTSLYLKFDEKVVTGGAELPDAVRPWSIYNFSETSYFFIQK